MTQAGIQMEGDYKISRAERKKVRLKDDTEFRFDERNASAGADQVGENLLLTGTCDFIDRINAEFYGRFPYPWRPRVIDCVTDPGFARVMLNQNLGDWQHKIVPQRPRIWVAGCGTNQAAITALNFPDAEVLGSDISGSSLEACGATARDLGVRNLELRQETLNQVDYREKFDFIICTGVIHHNADPSATLRKLAEALTPAGVLELMVYNRYHRILTSAFQKAVRLLAGTAGMRPALDKEFSITRSLAEHFPMEGRMGRMAEGYREVPDSQLADALMQPVENSYTVESLERMLDDCGLEFLVPCVSPWDAARAGVSWNLRFSQEDMRRFYEGLSDSRRWQVTNLLALEDSPLLWFYLKRKDSPKPRKTEREICDSFLRTRFKQTAVTRRIYVLGEDDRFEGVTLRQRYPSVPEKDDLRRIIKMADGGESLGRILDRLKISQDFITVNHLRLELTTSAFPYLTAVA